MEENHDEYVERDGVLRCKYCGSVSREFRNNADRIIWTDKLYKMYVIKDNKQYKFYVDHY